jgi:hypothetical protein
MDGGKHGFRRYFGLAFAASMSHRRTVPSSCLTDAWVFPSGLKARLEMPPV